MIEHDSGTLNILRIKFDNKCRVLTQMLLILSSQERVPSFSIIMKGYDYINRK